jgi:hypothetical protein
MIEMIAKNIVWFIIAVFICSCDMNNQKLVLVNQTDSNIYYRLLTDTADFKKDLYVYKLNARDTVLPNFVMGTDPKGWENTINNESADSTLHIFIFRVDALPDNRLTRQIIWERKYERYDFKVKDLEKSHWKLYY